MKKRHLRSVIVLAASCFTAQAALAQEAPVAPAPPPSDGRTTQAPAGNPAVQSLMRANNLSESEAEERIALQADILALLQNSSLLEAAGFVDLAVQHEPVYQVWLNFEDNRSKAALLKEVPPKLRRYVKLRQAKRGKPARAAGFNALSISARNTSRRVVFFLAAYSASPKLIWSIGSGALRGWRDLTTLRATCSDLP